MKKFFMMVAFMAVMGLATASAQPRAIGGNVGYGIGFSYQHGLGEKNMLDVAVNVPLFWGIGGQVTYDWIDPFGTQVPWKYKGEWHWYMGVGGAIGMYNFANPVGYAGAAGHIGIEYNFWFPLNLSLDYRPTIGPAFTKDAVAFNFSGLYDGITLGVRYRF